MSLYTNRHPFARIAPAFFATFVRYYCRLRVEGVENIPKEGAFILISNHSSHADTAVLFTAMPPKRRSSVVAAAAQDYFFDRGIRQFVARILFNVVPVNRNMRSRTNPLRHVVRALREGYGIVLYPEGTRSRDGRVGPFRSGVGRLIAEFPDIPVIPAWVEGSTRVLPKGAAVPRPRTVKVRFGAPLRNLKADLQNRATWQTVANQLRDEVLRLSQVK